ncbi:MAG: MopE-related protein, partial [Myxococcota bacterium]|nr:MopE-related protein [Myxococcota bacterium]
MRLLLVSSLLLFACRQGKNSEALQDVDGDGFTPSDGDCDDADAAIFPSAEEVCDGIDNDCDEEIDEEAGTLYYPDSDEDGYGPEELAEYHCEEPEGLVLQGGDCDDEDAAINPGATEVCDGVDNDCNEVIDDDTAEDASLWFEDADEDGYGNPDVVLSACDAPAGYVEDGFDCDDDNPDLNPGALDIPNDSIDQDCTGSDAQALTMEEISVGDLILSELMLDPLAVEDYKGEWFELHNTSVEGMDLYGLVIGSQITSFIVEEHIVIAPNAYVLFAVRDQLDQNGGMSNVDYVYSRDAIQLDNSGELTLYAPDGLELDQLSYAAADFPIQEGVAIVNGLLSADADTGDLWCNATTSYGDGDLGTPGAVNDPCDLDGDGFTSVDGDCDDLNDTIYPTATEYCDGVDNDCDELVDDEDDNLDVSQLATTFYADADLDGYGDASTTIEACSVPAGYVENDEDCDDSDPTISPDADEICDGIDNDCDGLGDDEDTVISGGNTYYLDSDGDGFGDPDVTGEACTLIEGYSEDFTDCDDTDAMVFVGQREACDDGVDNNCDSAFDGPLCEFNFGNLGSDGIKITNTSPTELAVLGFSLTSLGDVSGDGNPDFAVVSRFADDGGGTSSGSTYVYFGPQTADLGSSDADVILYGGSGEVSGQAVTGAQPILGLGGDHNGDGNNDIAINAIKASSEAGAIYIAQGPLSGTVDLSTNADAMIVGEVAGDQLGRGATTFLGDINGDGNDDLLVGSYKNDFGGTDAGAAYLLLGPVPASGTVSTVAAISLYGSSGDNLGYAVGAAGDVNGDGIADALVNANRMDTQDA